MLKLTIFASALLFSTSALSQSVAPARPVPGSFVQGLQLDAEIAQWHSDADARHYRRVLEAVNERVDKDGKLTLKAGENEIDFARAILVVCRVSKYKPQYFAAAKQVHDDLVTRSKPLTPREAFAATPFRVKYDVTFADAGDIPAALNQLKTRPDETVGDHPQAMRQEDTAWLAAATVDTLEALPVAVPHRAEILTDLRQLASRFPSTKSATPLVANLDDYILRKGVRLGYLPLSMKPPVNGPMQAEFDGDTATSGYLPVVALTQTEFGQTMTSTDFSNVNVTIDAWFNSQTRTTPAGNTELFHYKWDDEADSGYSFFGRAFQRFGAHLTTLAQEPTAQNLAASQVYIIVSPDIPAKNPHPHYVGPQDIEAITKWVANGGVLLLLHNDNTNTEFEHFNTLTERFGIHYNPVLKNPVEGTKWVQAQVLIPAKTTGVFQDAHLAYMKEIDTISTQPPAQPVLRDTLHGTGDVYMAVSHYGKGVVFATVDPWLYNEYTDGQKLGSYDAVRFDPFPAAIDLAHWALQQTRKP